MIQRSFALGLVLAGVGGSLGEAKAANECMRVNGGLTGNGIMISDAKNHYSFRYPEKWECRATSTAVTVEESLRDVQPQSTNVLSAMNIDATGKVAPTAYLGVDADKFVLDVRHIRSGSGGLAAYLTERFPRETWQKARISGRDGFQSFSLDTSRIYLPGEGDIVYVISNSVDRDGIPSAPMQMILDTFVVLP